jgi:hypothetical protein
VPDTAPTRSAAPKAAASVLKLPASTAVSTMFFCAKAMELMLATTAKAKLTILFFILFVPIT